MLVAAALCPHPPILVPELAVGAAAELDGLRAACDEAIAVMLGERADQLVVVGADPDGGTYPSSAGASMHPYGVDLRVGGVDGELPLALAIGAWLLDRAGSSLPVRYVGIAPDAPTSRCLVLGRTLGRPAERVGLLVLADGSARRTARSPASHDERGEPYDAMVTAALSGGDVAALGRLDAELAGELMVGGRAALQVLAGAAEPATGAGDRIEAEVRFTAAPYGVSYLVASWRLTTSTRGPRSSQAS